MRRSHDVIVVGLGGMGSAAAYHLARRGQRVLGLERFTPAHDRGSSHGRSRVIRQAYFEDPAYVPLVLRAYELWREAERASGADLLLITGALMIGAPGQRGRGRQPAQRPGVGPRPRTPRRQRPAAALPHLRPHCRHGGAVRSRGRGRATRGGGRRPPPPRHRGRRRTALRGTGRRLGGRRLRRRRHRHDGRGVERADRLVVCPGAWAPDLLSDLGVPFTVERQVQFWFEPVGGLDPFLPGRHPVWVWDGGGDGQPYGLPAVDGPERRREGRLVPAGPALHRRHPRPGRGGRGGRRDRRDAPGPDPVTRRAVPPGRRVPLHQHPRPALRRRSAPPAPPGRRGLRVLRARLQVRPGHRRDPGRPRRSTGRRLTRSGCSTRAGSG